VFTIKSITKNFLSVGLANLISQFVTFVTVAYYARILSVSLFGKLSLAQSIMIYFTMITLFGFQTYGQREIAKNSDKAEYIVGSIVSIRILISVICFFIVVLIAFIFSEDTIFKNILLMYGVTLFPLAFNIDWFFSGLKHMEYNAIYSIIKNVIPFILIIIFLKTEKDVLFIPVFYVIGLVIAVAFQSYVYRHKKKLGYKFYFPNKELTSYIKCAAPFLLSGILSMINCNVDSIIIGFLRSDRELGIYSSAYKIIFFITNLMNIVFVPVFPLFISYFNNKNKNLLNDIVDKTCRIVILVAIPISFGGIALSKEIIVLIFGKKYESAYIPLIILLIYVLILFIREIYGYGLNAFNMEKKYLIITAISSSINLFFNLIFIPIYGINAAAIVTILSEVINFLFMKKFFNTVTYTTYLSNIKKVILPTLCMFVSILLFKHFNINVIINILSAIVVYFIGIALFKYVTIDELKNMFNSK